MRSQAPFSLVEVPIDCFGTPGETELSPEVLRESGLAQALGMDYYGALPVRIDDTTRDPKSGIVGFKSVCHTTQVIRQSVGEILRSGRRPFLVGGCCTESMGAVAGARDYFGTVGFVNVDGHIDLYDGKTSPTGEAADIPVAAMLGYGPEGLMKVIGPKPPLKAEHVALLSFRDLAEARSRHSLLPSDINIGLHYDVEAVRAAGPTRVGEDVENFLADVPGMFWLHLDFDVLNMQVFPATDYLMPGGLNWEELVQLLRPLVMSSGLIGMSIACYNPQKDPGRKCANAIVTNLGYVFART